jgi:hypothetical protein
MLMRSKIAVVGEKDSVLGFKTVGFDVFETKGSQETAEQNPCPCQTGLRHHLRHRRGAAAGQRNPEHYKEVMLPPSSRFRAFMEARASACKMSTEAWSAPSVRTFYLKVSLPEDFLKIIEVGENYGQMPRANWLRSPGRLSLPKECAAPICSTWFRSARTS